MNDPALVRYLKTCCRRLNQQQTTLINDFGLRTCGEIEVRLSSGLMHLDLPGRGRAIANVTPLARYQPSRQIWTWVWAESAPFSLHRHGAEALQSMAKKTGLGLFATAEFKLSFEQTLLLLAMACSRFKASGYYCWKIEAEFLFFAINHMALATAPLEYDHNGDRLQLAQLPHLSEEQSQTQLSQRVRPAPSLLGHSSAPAWPNQRSVEGLFMHSLCQGDWTDRWEDWSQILIELKSLMSGSLAS